MIFLDTSALVRRYLVDEGEDILRGLAPQPVALSALAWVEFHSAVARRRRAGALAEAQSRHVLREISSDWGRYEVVPVEDRVLAAAADLVGKHALRSLDAIQLASALVAAEGDPSPLRFGSLDARLNAAAKDEGLALLVRA